VSRIVQPIDESKLVTLACGMPRRATAKNDRGAVADSFRLNHMYLRLQRSAQQQQALERALEALQDPQSANYHQWLTAEELTCRARRGSCAIPFIPRFTVTA
jgi:hypothetical protein